MSTIRRLLFRGRISQVESVLGTKLEDWQVDYIFGSKVDNIPKGTPNRTLTYALKQLLAVKNKYVWKLGRDNATVIPYYSYDGYAPISDDRNNASVFYHRDYLIKWKKLFMKLTRANIPTAQVLWDWSRGGAFKICNPPEERSK